MKTQLSKIIILALFALLITKPDTANSQTKEKVRTLAIPPHIAYIHGIFSAPSEMSPLQTEMSKYFYSSTSLEDYASLGLWNGIVQQAQTIEDTIQSNWHSMNVLVGHSMGGVEARSVAQQYTSTTIGYVTVDAPNAGARFADAGARQRFTDAFAYDRGQIQRQTIGPLGSLAGIVYQITALAVDWIGYFGQDINGNIQDLVPGSTFMTNLYSGASAEVAAFGSKRCAVWSSCMTPRLPAFNSTNIQGDQASFKGAIQDCWNQNNYWNGEANRLNSECHWYNAWVIWPRTLYARSRAGDYSAAANAYPDENNSWENNTMDGEDGDSFISVSSQKHIGRLDSGHLYEVGTDGSPTDQVNHGGAVFGVSNGYKKIEAAMIAAGAQ